MAGRQLCISFTVEKKTLLTPTPAGAEYLIMTKDGSQCQGKFKFDGKIDAPASTEASVKAEPGLEMTETQMPLDLPVKDEPMDANPADDSGFIEGKFLIAAVSLSTAIVSRSPFCDSKRSYGDLFLIAAVSLSAAIILALSFSPFFLQLEEGYWVSIGLFTVQRNVYVTS